MRVADVMTPDPVSVTPATSVSEAKRLMERGGFRHLPVVADGELVGILSDRDVTIRDPEVVASLTALRSDLLYGTNRHVGQLMSRPLHVVAPGTDLAVASRILSQHAIGALPVVEDGRLVGIVTVTDCLRALQEGGDASTS